MRIAAKPKDDEAEWHKWFAWHPVRTGIEGVIRAEDWGKTHQWVWGEWVERKYWYDGKYEYRLICD